MCGICGMICGDDGHAADSGLVERMNAALAHRGPDDDGVYAHGPCSMGVRRLSVIDVERGHQPMVSDGSRHAVVFNGEIYNAPAVRTDLEKRRHRFRTHCDTEVLLNACIEWGDDAVNHLNGMFAFAFYDAEKRRLLLVRDRLGIKTLFVLESGGDLYFASELDALVRSGKLSGAIDPGSFDAYFTCLYVPGPETIFKDVAQIGPGERLVWHAGKADRSRYWVPTYEADPDWTLDSASDRYMELVCDSVRHQRISDVPLGAFLSGGVDSATVVAALSEAAAGPVETFTIGFRDPDADERPFADLVAHQFGTSHTSEVMEPDVVELLPQLVSRFGQPFADSSALPTYLVSQLARESVTVALSGDGGDELFAGYSWLHMTERARAWRRVPSTLRRIFDAITVLGNVSPAMEKLHRFNQDSFLPDMDIFRRRQSCFYPSERSELYQPAVRRSLERAVSDRYQELWESVADRSTPDRMLHQDLCMYLPDDILTKVDRMSMAVSLEVRVPLLDHRIVEFAGALPFHLKFDRGVSKRVPKHAFRDILPQAVLKQRKRGFSIPVDRWFRESLGEYFKETVLATDTCAHKWLNPLEIARVWEVHQSGRRNFGHRLWCLLAFELWLRYVAEHVDVGLEGS